MLKSCVALCLPIFVGLSMQAAIVHAQEARCQELGEACICSEPLNNDDEFERQRSGNLSSHDFSDSPPETSCRHTYQNSAADYAFSPSAGAAHHMAVDTNSGFDLPGVEYVLENEYPSSGAIGSSDEDFTDGTWCMRSYEKYSEGWPDMFAHQTGDEDVKLMRFEGTDDGTDVSQEGVIGVQCVWKWNHVECAVPSDRQTAFGCIPGVNCGSWQWVSLASGSVTHTDCQENWCRIEFCADHNSRTGEDADKLVMRLRITNLGTGAIMEYPPIVSIRSHPTAHTGASVKLRTTFTPDWGHGHCEGGGGRCSSGAECESGACRPPTPYPTGERSWHSHIMVARLPVADESFWIGPAVEVEGADGTLPTVPPATTDAGSTTNRDAGGSGDASTMSMDVEPADASGGCGVTRSRNTHAGIYAVLFALLALRASPFFARRRRHSPETHP